MWELEGYQNEYYRKGSSSLTASNANPQSQSGLTLFYKDPKIALKCSNYRITKEILQFFKLMIGNKHRMSLRWMTHLKVVMEWKRFGFCSNGTASEDNYCILMEPGNNGVTEWTNDPQGQQIGEVFVDGMPFRNWNGTENLIMLHKQNMVIHLLGTHLPR